MPLKVDKAGRIVLPKRVRQRLRLEPGSQLRLEERADGILLRPMEQRIPLTQREGGLLIHCGEVPPGFDWDRFIEDQREERIEERIQDTRGL